MSSSQYSVLVSLEIDTTGLQNKINNATKKKVKITMAADLDQKSLDLVLQKWKNKVEKLKITKPAIFNNVDVQKQIGIFETMIQGFKAGNVTMQQVNGQWGNVDVAMAKAGATMKNVTKDGYNMGDMMGIAVKKMIIWQMAAELIFGSMRKLQEGIQYIKDLNKEMVNIQIVNGMSAGQVADLAMQYNGLAKELGSTTLEVAAGSLEWI